MLIYTRTVSAQQHVEGGQMMENIFGRFEFLDFEPTNELKSSAKGILHEIVGESPSDANSVASVRKTHAGFEGILKVSSRAGTFIAHAVEHDPLHAIQKMQEKICEQLQKW